MSTTGEILRRTREEKGISLDEAASRTKLKRDVLEAIEEGDLDRLSSRSYAPFFIKSYCRYLGIAPPAADDAEGGDRGSRRRKRRRAPRSGDGAPAPEASAPRDAGPSLADEPLEPSAAPGDQDPTPVPAEGGPDDADEPAPDLFDMPRPRARPAGARNTPRRPAPVLSWTPRGIAIAVVAAVVVVAAVIFWPRGGGEPGNAAPGDGPIAEEPAVVGGGPYELVVHAEEMAAVRVTSGGEVLFDDVMAPGERQSRISPKPFQVWASPASAVRLYGDSRRLPFGDEGAAERTWPGPRPESEP